MKTNLSNSKQKIKKLHEEKKKLEEDLAGSKEKVMKKYKPSNQFTNDLVDESLNIFYEGFKDCKRKIKELLPNFDIALLVPSISIPKEKSIAVEDTAEDVGAAIGNLLSTT